VACEYWWFRSPLATGLTAKNDILVHVSELKTVSRRSRFKAGFSYLRNQSQFPIVSQRQGMLFEGTSFKAAIHERLLT
jgi:hypothetical protein